MSNLPSDHYRMQRLVLLPTAGPLPADELRAAVQGLSEQEEHELPALILEQKLQSFWLEALSSHPDLPFSHANREWLRQQCLKTTLHYLGQKKALLELDRILAAAAIPYVIIKGAHIREVIYPNPAWRPSADIDLLVSPQDTFKAVQVLCAQGYTLVANLANVSHEASLTRDTTCLDLHWHIMRPGRTRIDLTGLFLQSRRRCEYFWALDDELTLLVLLTHPVFTEYSTGPQSAIVKLVDLKRWITQRDIDWQRLLTHLAAAGLKTAAWITATFLADLTGCRLPNAVYEAIRPANPRRFLLQQWLNLNLSSRFAAHPVIPKYIFTLLAHDSLQDMFRFIRIFRATRRQDAATLEMLLQAGKHA